MLVEHSSQPRSLAARQHDVADMVELLKTGAHLPTAAAHVGLNPSTVAGWLKEGQSLMAIADRNPDRQPSGSEKLLIEFAEAVTRAQAEAEVSAASVVWDAAHVEGDAKSAMWLLERRFKERWGQRTEVTGAGGGAIEVEDVGKTRQLVAEALGKMAEQIAAAEDAMVAEVVSIDRDGEDGEGLDDGVGWEDAVETA